MFSIKNKLANVVQVCHNISEGCITPPLPYL